MKIKLPNKLIFHTDPGHGWLACKRQLLADLGITDKVSCFSYQKGGTVYLEEDCDVTLLFDALELHGFMIEDIQLRIRDSYRERSPIRSYASFCP